MRQGEPHTHAHTVIYVCVSVCDKRLHVWVYLGGFFFVRCDMLVHHCFQLEIWANGRSFFFRLSPTLDTQKSSYLSAQLYWEGKGQAVLKGRFFCAENESLLLQLNCAEGNRVEECTSSMWETFDSSRSDSLSEASLHGDFLLIDYIVE